MKEDKPILDLDASRFFGNLKDMKNLLHLVKVDFIKEIVYWTFVLQPKLLI